MNLQKTNRIYLLIACLLTIHMVESKKVNFLINPKTFEKKSCFFVSKFFTKKGTGSLTTELSVKESTEKAKEASLFLYTFAKKNSQIPRKLKASSKPNFCDEFQQKYDTLTEYHTELKPKQSSITNSKFGINTENRDKDPVEYFFYLCDCNRDFQNLIHQSNKISLSYTVRITDEDSNHHGAESAGITKVISFFILIFGSLLFYGILTAYENKLKNDVYDYPYVGIISIPFIMLCGLFLKLIHNLAYGYNGTGISLLEIISRCWLMAADSALSFLLILMIRGWGTKFVMLGQEYEKVLVCILLTILARYGWTVHAWWQYHEDVYHIFDGIAGRLEIGISVVKYIWFILFWRMGSLGSSRKYKQFSKMLFCLASLLFFVRPLAVISIGWFDEVRRYSMSLFGILAANAFVVLILLVIFGKEDGLYMKVAFSGRVKIQMTHDDEEGEHFHNN